MSRKLAFVVAAATILGASAVAAQRLEISPEGPRIDLRNREQRERDREMRGERFDRDRVEERRGGRCRTVTVREEDDEGRTVTRRRRECRD